MSSCSICGCVATLRCKTHSLSFCNKGCSQVAHNLLLIGVKRSAEDESSEEDPEAKKTKLQNFWLTLPQEIRVLLLSPMPILEMLRKGRTSKHIRSVLFDERFWRAFCNHPATLRTLGGPGAPDGTRPNLHSWREQGMVLLRSTPMEVYNPRPLPSQPQQEHPILYVLPRGSDSDEFPFFDLKFGVAWLEHFPHESDIQPTSISLRGVDKLHRQLELFQEGKALPSHIHVSLQLGNANLSHLIATFSTATGALLGRDEWRPIGVDPSTISVIGVVLRISGHVPHQIMATWDHREGGQLKLRNSRPFGSSVESPVRFGVVATWLNSNDWISYRFPYSPLVETLRIEIEDELDVVSIHDKASSRIIVPIDAMYPPPVHCSIRALRLEFKVPASMEAMQAIADVGVRKAAWIQTCRQPDARVFFHTTVTYGNPVGMADPTEAIPTLVIPLYWIYGEYSYGQPNEFALLRWQLDWERSRLEGTVPLQDGEVVTRASHIVQLDHEMLWQMINLAELHIGEGHSGIPDGFLPHDTQRAHFNRTEWIETAEDATGGVGDHFLERIQDLHTKSTLIITYASGAVGLIPGIKLQRPEGDHIRRTEKGGPDGIASKMN
jgi:hypothetical protein